jgi:hypothetical protein
MAYRAAKSGLAAEAQKKIVANYDPEVAKKCLAYIQAITGCSEIPSDYDSIDASHDHFHELLYDGMLLCKFIDALYPGKINWNDKTFQTPKIEAMRVMRERERIAMFTKLVTEFGVPDTYAFPTESLHERSVANLAQVCVCIRALGIEAQTKPGYSGPPGYWPKKSEKNVREFSEEQMKAGQNVIGLQMGTNKGANQSGMSMGKSRMIID